MNEPPIAVTDHSKFFSRRTAATCCFSGVCGLGLPLILGWARLHMCGLLATTEELAGLRWPQLSMCISPLHPTSPVSEAWRVLVVVAGALEKWKHASEFPSLCSCPSFCPLIGQSTSQRQAHTQSRTMPIKDMGTGKVTKWSL